MKEQIKEIISKLTLRQKADLMSGRDFWSTTPYEELGVPSAFLADGPHGVRKQAAASDHLGLNQSIPATCYPTAVTMANTWNPELGEQMGEALGAEAASQRVNVLLGPGMNIKRNPRCGRNFEYFSEDPLLAGKMAASYVRGIQKNGISACLKHFAANNQETRRMVNESVIDERALREIYLTGFEIAVKEGGARTIMSSYNMLNGQFTNENEHLLKDILRGEWGYKGVIVTDWAGCNSRVEGAKCGNELEMPVCKYGNDDLVKAVESGELDESVLDENLERLLELILTTDKALKESPDSFDVEKHDTFASMCAEESIVLLKNENVLPLNKEDKVLIVGDFAREPRYQGAGSSIVNPTKLLNFFEAIEASGAFPSYKYVQGYDRYGKKKAALLKEAVAAASEYENIIFFAGLDEVTEAEGIDRRDIKIPAAQLEVLRELNKLGKKVIVVLCCGAAVELDEVNNANAIVHAYLGGQAGARSVLKVLLGEVNPSGKLSETLPVKYEDCASADIFPGMEMTTEYRESLYVGYRYYSTAKVPVNYPFGYGLSYTTYEYSNLEVTEDGVKLTVTNTGKMDGKEVVQLYISKKDSAIFRPVRELKGFAKPFVKAGESVEVVIPFDDKTFRYFNVKTNKWEIEAGEYTVEIGASCEDIRLTGSIVKEGTTDVLPYDKEALAAYYNCDVRNVSAEQFRALYGKELPKSGYTFYKKNRMVIHENCTISDLRYSKRWVGRFFSWAIRFAKSFFWKIGMRSLSNTLEMGMVHQPIRGLAKFGGMSRRQMEALIMMFNGHVFKGIGRFLTKEKSKK